MTEVRFPAEAGNISLRHRVLTDPPSLLFDVYRGFLPRGESYWNSKLTTNVHLVPRLRMRGTIPPHPRVFMAWCLVKYRYNFTLSLLRHVVITPRYAIKQRHPLKIRVYGWERGPNLLISKYVSNSNFGPCKFSVTSCCTFVTVAGLQVTILNLQH
jgi:hypothetical protein